MTTKAKIQRRDIKVSTKNLRETIVSIYSREKPRLLADDLAFFIDTLPKLSLNTTAGKKQARVKQMLNALLVDAKLELAENTSHQAVNSPIKVKT